MKINLNDFEQSIEDNAEKFVPLSNSEKNDIEAIISVANKTKNKRKSITQVR